MKIPSMDTIINKGRTTARKVEQYATRENLRAAKKEVNESLHNAAKDFKNSKIGKWIIGKVNAFTEIAKPYIDGFKQKITDNKFVKGVKEFATEKFNKITEKNYIKKGIDWVKDKYNKVVENPTIKGAINSVKNFFKPNDKVA